MTELGYSNTLIGLFSIFHLPYSMRICWGPIIDNFKCPFFFPQAAQKQVTRRSWTLMSLIFTFLSMIGLGVVDPLHSPIAFATLVTLSCLFTGCVYMAGLAYELDSLDQTEYLAGSASVNAGYRIGLLVGGAGTLYLASYFSWEEAYIMAAAFMLLGILAVYLQQEPYKNLQREDITIYQSFTSLLYQGLSYPVYDFLKKNNILSLLAFVLLYRLGDDLTHSFLYPFYLQIGFTKTEIASIVKILGMGGTLFGVLLGGTFGRKLPIDRALLYFGALHALSYILYMRLSIVGYDLNLFCVTIAYEHITSGLVITTFIAYLWKISSPKHAAMQYALLWSLLSCKQVVINAVGGVLADTLEWHIFFFIAILLFIPGLAMLQLRAARLRDCPST